MAADMERNRNANKRFLCEFEFDGSRWGVDIYASTREEAEMKLRAVAGGEVLGPCGGVVPMACPKCGYEPEIDNDNPTSA